MFERFTRSARDAVTAGMRLAAGAYAPEVREEHLALGILDGTGTPALQALEAAGCTAQERADLVDDLTALSHRAGVTEADADALRELGIDVDEVLARLPELARDVMPVRRSRSRRRRFGRVQWSRAAKQALERALREAIDLTDNSIHDGYLLLALLGSRGSVAEVMRARGVSYGAVRRAVAYREAS